MHRICMARERHAGTKAPHPPGSRLSHASENPTRYPVNESPPYQRTRLRHVTLTSDGSIVSADHERIGRL